MEPKLFILLCLQLSIGSLYAQTPAGKWYETENPNVSLEINIDKTSDTYSGTFNWERKSQINVANAPLKNVTVKNDSLLFELAQGSFRADFKLKKDNETDGFKGFFYNGTRLLGPVTLSRNPITRDMTVDAVPGKTYTRQDTLRGKITDERAWWDLTHYNLDFELDIENKYLKGSNTIIYRVLEPKKVMQIDLQPPLKITKVVQAGESLVFTQEGNAYFVQLKQDQIKGASKAVEVFYEGNPKEAPRAPWDGGFSWEQDSNGKPLVYTSCQGEGASLWWPNKDHMYDEPDNGMTISVTVPEDLMAVANGRLTATEEKDNGTTKYQWTVVNPINNYGVAINVADYIHFSDPYNGIKGTLACDYYVLPENLEKAKLQFEQVHLMLEAFEHWFGPYPFYEDGYKLVEGVGMEHQSSIGYSEYGNGNRGNDYSGTDWGFKFDYLIIHESGHEWFANNITYKDMADMWLHEGFTTYSEALYLEYHFGEEAGKAYIKGISQGIANDIPIIGDYDVNDKDYSKDIYHKGAAILHTLRQVINDDEKWRAILTGLNEKFYLQTVTTEDVENYISQEAGLDLNTFFDQYLRTTQIPTLEYYFKDNKFAYRWLNTVPGFNMPLKIKLDNLEQWIYPTPNWTYEYTKDTKTELIINPDFYAAGFRNMK
ncbi:M1 family metallopeptidase [Psychroflexus sp. CAK57W]|uniref:M1 family metallopeptidase n=1 Tax=Psychroflexus curvus TaxID=2873595 RepID=UPI001CCF3095|nr:M1 family metallopeptidase [Psychroflexus curvus]MBZ9786686.1 M1 family metallopeptidase [Psychroflexus curvus]